MILIGSSSLSLHVTSSAYHDERFSLVFTYFPFYFDLSFTVFFHSSVLVHPDLHIDLDNLDSVENNLRHSAKGSNDAYDVTSPSHTTHERNEVSDAGVFSMLHTARDYVAHCRGELCSTHAFQNTSECCFVSGGRLAWTIVAEWIVRLFAVSALSVSWRAGLT